MKKRAMIRSILIAVMLLIMCIPVISASECIVDIYKDNNSEMFVLTGNNYSVSYSWPYHAGINTSFIFEIGDISINFSNTTYGDTYWTNYFENNLTESIDNIIVENLLDFRNSSLELDSYKDKISQINSSLNDCYGLNERYQVKWNASQTLYNECKIDKRTNGWTQFIMGMAFLISVVLNVVLILRMYGVFDKVGTKIKKKTKGIGKIKETNK